MAAGSGIALERPDFPLEIQGLRSRYHPHAKLNWRQFSGEIKL
jgi:hypothetical protein